ncbi:metal-dependent hydrolase [Sphingobium sp.]|uniref:metal-dependent hydrolase n=1 Tax=Sphingobium sp. TaxID=1912891 RepID=UPI0028BF1D72|nr:metal-dependent hydrolase [Sphingobium sp.]
MIVRYPRIDYSKIRAHWAPNIAFAQLQNATSIIPGPVEPWLIKVLQKAMDFLPADKEKLREDMATFIGQESQHFRQHRMFNKVIAAQGYPALAGFEKQLADDLEGFCQNRSLKFMLAYADGFESLGAVQGGIWFGRMDKLIEGADPNAIALWKWHMAEEFEHREVCFQIYHALYSRGLWGKIWNGYFYRIYGCLYAMVHLWGYMGRMFSYMIQQDMLSMNAEEQAAFGRDIKALKRFQTRVFFPQLLKNFLPWYNPGRKPTPVGLFEYLREFEKRPQEAEA